MSGEESGNADDGNAGPRETAAAGGGGAPAPGPRLAGDPAPDEAMTIRLFEQAVADHSRRLLAVARGIVGYRASPEDVVQQALLNLYKHRNRYDWREPGGLMRRAVVNESLRVLRQPPMGLVQENTPAKTAEPVEPMIEGETVAAVRKAIDRLPEHYRSALVLCEYEQMPYAQIAETLGVSLAQVKTWIFRARRQLAEMLKDVVNV